MNDQTASSAPGASLIPDSTSIITGTHFVFMAIFAVLVVLGILWGMRLRHSRDRAEEQVIEDNRDIRVTDRDPASASAVGDATRAAEAATGQAVTAPRAQKASADEDATPRRDPAPDAPVAATAASGPNDVPATNGEAIPVTRLKGLGPKVAARLNELGITDARQLAALSDQDAARLDEQLGTFSGRMARDRWIEQARLLAAGDTKGFETAFGKL